MVNARLIFPVIERHPCLLETELLVPAGSRVVLNAYSGDNPAPAKRVTFGQIISEVESYLSLLTHLDPVQFYVGIRVYETGIVGLPQVTRIASNLHPGTTLGTELLRQRTCNWEDLLAVCLDVPRVGSQLHVPPPAEYELVGEILVELGKVTRTELQKALNLKRGGDKPLGEILMQMGVCTKMDIETCLRAQQKVMANSEDRVGLLGELLVQFGVVTYDDLEQALRMQRIGRQPLPAVLISMGVCTQDTIEEFRFRHPQYVTQGGIDEKALAQYLVYYKLVNERQLEEARRIQSRGRLVLGELLINLQKCTVEDIERVIGRQESMREEARKAPKKFGEILVQHNVVSPDKVEEAARRQSISRQKMGSTLMHLGTCSEDDFTDALELQFSWRQAKNESADRLGQELLNRNEVSQQNLERALALHNKAGKPLGQILVETESATPESVIDTLIQREERRRSAFIAYLRQNAGEPPAPVMPAQAAQPARQAAVEPEADKGIVDKISSWFGKRNQS